MWKWFLRMFQSWGPEKCDTKRLIRQRNDTRTPVAKTAEIKILSDSISVSEWFYGERSFQLSWKRKHRLTFWFHALERLAMSKLLEKKFLPVFYNFLFCKRARAEHSSKSNPCKYSKTCAQQPHLISLINCGFCLHSRRWFFSRLTAER